VLSQLENIKVKLDSDKESKLSRVLQIAEKLFIPLLIACLAWLGSNAATKISEGQLELAATNSRLQTQQAISAAEDRKQEFRLGMQAKYIEIFYRDLNSGDPKSQMNAIRLVQLADPDLAQSLLTLVPSTPGVSSVVLEQAKEARQSLDMIKPLTGYKIGIFYYGDSKISAERALDLRNRLQRFGFTGSIQLTSVDDESVKQYDPPKKVEIRYEPGLEDDQANALSAILVPIVAPSSVSKEPVRNRSVNYVSVFLPRST